MIALPFTALIAAPAQKVGQLHIQQFGQVLPNRLLDVCTDHLKQPLRFMANLLVKIFNFRYSEFHCHGRFSFLVGMFGRHPCKGKAPFLRSLPNSHKKAYTRITITPGSDGQSNPFEEEQARQPRNKTGFSIR
jgi:hypothetical protein